jgi:hypothetical protein
VRYKALVATGHTDAYGYTFSGDAMDDLAEQAVGKDVWLMFTQVVGQVVGASRGEKGVTVVFESDKELSGFYCVPSFHDERLELFGLVTAPANTALTCVREVER